MASSTAAAKKAEKKALKEILQELSRLGGKLQDDTGIVFEGTEVKLPASMDIDGGIRFLERKKSEMEAFTSFDRVFNYRPWDGAYCMYNVFKRQFGAVMHKGTPGFFIFPGDPPKMVTVQNDVNSTIQVPWGNFDLPGMDGVTFTPYEASHPELGPLFGLYVEGPKKWEGAINGLFSRIEDELKTNSMYRGKAFDGQERPEFVDLSTVDRGQVVYSNEVMRQLEANIWGQLRNTEQFEKHGIPLKRAVLLHGPFGTGKTLAALLTGQEAVANGWTFIRARPGRDNLSFVMQTARLYQPAVVFYEDVDQLTDPTVASESNISKLLDDFDGIDAKGTRILCVLTTNYPERINAAMARPGRLDAMIEINELDVDGVSKLVKTRVKDLLADEIDWEAVFEAAQGYKPAFVTEFATRAIRYAITSDGRDADDKTDIDDVRLTTENLVAAAEDLRPQYDVMTGARDRHEAPQIDGSLRTLVNEVVGEVVQDTLRRNVHENLLVEPALAENGNS